MCQTRPKLPTRPIFICSYFNANCFLAGMITTAAGPLEMVKNWAGGFWSLLAFSMQMALVLVTGHTLASTPIVKKALEALAKPCKTPLQAIVAVTFISTIACWINWGFGLVVGALYAKQTC